MKYIFKIEKYPEWVVKDFARLLPPEITYKENSGSGWIFLDVASSSRESEACHIAEKETNRIGFLTGCSQMPVLHAIDHGSGRTTQIRSHTANGFISKPLDPSIVAQQWKDTLLEAQLLLWRWAKTYQDNLALHIILLFQIIELEHPRPDEKYYPKYASSLVAPDCHTEAMLLRDLFSHHGSKMRSQLRNYCTWLKIPETFPAPGDTEVLKTVSKRLHVMEKLARDLIDRRMTRT